MIEEAIDFGVQRGIGGLNMVNKWSVFLRHMI